MPIQGYTPNRNLPKIAAGSTDNWDVWSNQALDTLDEPSLVYKLTAAEDLSKGEVAAVLDDGAGAKKAYLAASGTYTFGDPLGVALDDAAADSPTRLVMSGRVQNNGWSFGPSDKHVYLSASGTVTTVETQTKIGYVLSATAIFFNTGGVSSGGGQTNTVSGSGGLANTGDNVDAVLQPVYGSSAQTVCEGNDSRLHSQNTDTHTDSASFEINAFGNGARLLTTGLTANRDYTFPNANTKLVGEGAAASITSDHDFSSGTLRLPTASGAPTFACDEGDIVYDTSGGALYIGQGGTSWAKAIVYRGFSANKNGTSQTISSGVWTKITWGAEEWDTDGDFDLVNSRFYPQKAGKWLLAATLWHVSPNDGVRVGARLYKNGSFFKNMQILPVGGAESTSVSGLAAVDTAVGDYFEIYGYQESGVDKNISGSADSTYFQGAYQGP